MASELVLKIKNPFTVPEETAIQPGADDFVTIGRGEGNDVIIISPFVSRQHITLQRGESGWLVRDLNSRNGSRLNKSPVSDDSTGYLGDVIEIGDVVITLLGSGDDVAKRLLTSSPLENAAAPDTAVDGSAAVQSKLESANKAQHSFGKGGGLAPRRLSDTRSYRLRRQRARFARMILLSLSFLLLVAVLWQIIDSL